MDQRVIVTDVQMRFGSMVTLIVVALALAGCVAYQPGAGVTPRVMEAWGCDYPTMQERIEYRKANKSSSEVWIPQVGWDVCELLAAVGAPTSVDRIQSASGRSVNFWYQEPNAATHLVSLEQRASGRWIVDYVGW